jgi:hypothetical protein
LKIAFGVQERTKAVAQDGVIVDQNKLELGAMQGAGRPSVTVSNGKHGEIANVIMSHGLFVRSVEHYNIYNLRESII